MRQTAAEGWWVIRDTKLGLRAVRATCGLRDQLAGGLLGVFVLVVGVVVALGEVRIRALDLYKTLTTDRLGAASGLIEVRRISEKADWTFGCVLVEENFHGLAINKRVVWGDSDLARGHGHVGC